MKWTNSCPFTVSGITWERIFLKFKIHSETDIPSETAFVLMSLDPENPKGVSVEKGQIPLSPREQKLREWSFCLNMAAANGRSFLDNGQWRLCALNGGQIFPVSIDCEEARRQDEWARIFKYGKNKYAYNVSFSVQEVCPNRLELVLSSFFVRVNPKWRKRKYVQEAVTLKGKFRRFYLWLVIVMIRCYYFAFSRLIPKHGDRVLFMTETKDYLWGNLKYIHDRMIERGLNRRFKISCACRKSVGHQKSALSWIKTVGSIAASDFIFIDDYAPVFGFFKLYKKTKLIQVWHAGEGFKSVGYSRFGREGSPFPSGSCHKAYTFALTGAPELVPVYEEVFGIEKDAILPLGMARLDHFLDQEKIDAFTSEFYKKWPDLKGKKIILFAPTFRGAGQKDAWYDYSRLDFSRIYDFCGDEYIFLIKMHPFITERPDIPKIFRTRICDFSDYPDINELFYITDLLITDYSSNYYEFALLKRPVLFYTYDRAFYELTRGVHRSVKDNAPGKVCDTFDQLMTALETKDYEIDKTLTFAREHFGNYDGHASDRIINQILLDGSETHE